MESQRELESRHSDESVSSIQQNFIHLVDYFHGLDGEVDKLISLLRKQLNNNEKEAVVSQTIESIVLRLVDKHEFIERNDTKNNFIIIDTLMDSELPDDFKVALVRLAANLKKNPQKNVVEALAKMICTYVEILNQHSAKAKKQKRSFFSRKKPVDTPQSISIPRNLRESLTFLLEQLASVEINEHAVTNLKIRAESVENIEQLSSLLDDIAAALVEVVTEEHSQFESFLKTLNKRLNNVSFFFSQSQEHLQTAKNQNRNLHQSVSSQAISIQSQVENSADIQHIKSSVNDSVSEIVKMVATFCTEQEQLVDLNQEKIDKLEKELKETRTEAEDLKQSLADQRHKAQNDALTDLPNRYAYNERLKQEFSRWRRYRTPLSLVIIDIDHFKNVNDSHGHKVGDLALCQIGDLLKEGLRDSDFVARYGGEEFVLLLPETSLQEATKATNKLRQTIHNTPLIYQGHDIQLSVSAGVAEFEKSDTAEVVFTRADSALYRAKDKGRNQVCCERASY